MLKITLLLTSFCVVIYAEQNTQINLNRRLHSDFHLTHPPTSTASSNSLNQDAPPDCKVTRAGYNYTGGIAYTFNHKRCLPWPAQNNTSLEYFCKNDNHSDIGPWCYTSVLHDITEHCAIPICDVSEDLNEVYIRNPQNSFIKKHLFFVGDIIVLSIFPVILLIGTVLNVLSIAVFTRPSLRHSSTSLLLRILAYVDILSLYMTILTRWLRLLSGWQLEADSDLGCRLHFYINHVVFAMSSWVLVVITFERVIVTRKPHKAKVLCNKKNASLVMVIILVFVCLVNFPLIFGSTPEYQSLFSEDQTSFTIYATCTYCCIAEHSLIKVMGFVFNMFSPFIIILVGNVSIAVHLARATKRRSRMSSSSIRAGTVRNNGTKPPKSDANQLNSLTRLLMGVSFSYLILTLPYMIYLLVYKYTEHLYESRDSFLSSKHFWNSLTLLLLCINNSINFVLYCVGGNRFRNEFLSLIGCGSNTGSPRTSSSVCQVKPADNVRTSHVRQLSVKSDYSRSVSGKSAVVDSVLTDNMKIDTMQSHV